MGGLHQERHQNSAEANIQIRPLRSLWEQTKGPFRDCPLVAFSHSGWQYKISVQYLLSFCDKQGTCSPHPPTRSFYKLCAWLNITACNLEVLTLIKVHQRAANHSWKHAFRSAGPLAQGFEFFLVTLLFLSLYYSFEPFFIRLYPSLSCEFPLFWFSLCLFLRSVVSWFFCWAPLCGL